MAASSSDSSGLFPTTLWSMVMDAGHEDEARSLQALERLARAYWQPLYVFARQRGSDHHQTCDMVQGFFLHLFSREALQRVERRETRFRTFLLACFTHWLSNQRRGEATQRRGGGAALLPVDEVLAREENSFSEDQLGAEHGFDRRWARAIFDHALARLDEELNAAGDRREFFTELRLRLVGPAAIQPGWEGVASRFGMSVGAVRKAAHDLRQRFVEMLRHEVRKVVGSDDEVDEELRYLARLLTSGGHSAA